MKKLIFKKLILDINVFFLIAILCTATVIWVIQAVNFLDIISEDGHAFKVYFLYTVFNLPKIISKILPFIFLASLINILIRYEINNELIIFWLLGINKIKFINMILKLSILYFLFQVLLTSVLVPYSLDKARSFFRNSNLDLFTSIIKEKKFIDTVSNLTIFVEEKNGNDIKKIILKDRISKDEFQIIVAQTGTVISNNLSKSLILYNGKIINYSNNNQKIIEFSEFNFDLSNFTTKTTTYPKIQENSSRLLVKCLSEFSSGNEISPGYKKLCTLQSKNAMTEELFKRFYSPLYIMLIALISTLVIIKSKNNKRYGTANSLIFIMGIFVIILSEISLGHLASRAYGSYL
ncbi:LptF/LptG family permease, partial [Candidatus Pelagibacter sp.]|nr:LptF/LptG family permease [Candidatus Pelagibacter sp.]